MANGQEMAGEDWGGLLGHPIKVIKEDTAIQPATALAKAEKLVFKDGAVALIGGFSSGVGLGIMENIERLGVPFVTTHVMTTEFYDAHDYVFRSGQLANDQTVRGTAMAILADPDLRNQKFYIIAHDYAWGWDEAERFIDLARANDIAIVQASGGKEHEGFTYATAPTSTTDWSSFITAYMATDATAIFSPLITTVQAPFTKQARDMGCSDPIMGGALPGEVSLEACGDKCLGLYAVADWSWGVNNDISDEWEMRFFDKYDMIPTDAAYHSYIGAMNLYRAIQNAGSTDPDLISACLKGVSTESGYGWVRISALDNCMVNDAFLFEVKAAPSNPYGCKMVLDPIYRFSWDEIQRGDIELVSGKLQVVPYEKVEPLG